MIILINSLKGNSTALTRLLTSIKRHDESKLFRIIVVVGGYYEQNTYISYDDDNVTYIQAYHNSIDFTALITVLEFFGETHIDEKSNDQAYFYMHDTCIVGDTFLKFLLTIDLENKTTIGLLDHMCMNIGVYTHSILVQFKDFLLKMKNCDESKTMEYKVLCVECEDYIFKHDSKRRVFVAKEPQFLESEPCDFYGNGVLRKIFYYPHVDLFKIKANWHLATTYELKL